MTRFVKIAYQYNHDPWTRSEVWVRGDTTMNTLGHHWVHFLVLLPNLKKESKKLEILLCCCFYTVT